MNTAQGQQRWSIALLLGLGVLVNYFDRVNLSVSHDALVASFGISDITFGLLLSTYNWTYALCQLPCGIVLDRYGVRKVGCFSTFLWSVASFAAGLAPGINSFFGARLLLGVGEAPTFPANAKAIGYWFPENERSFATSLFDAAAKLATAIGVPLIGLLLLHIGWRLSFAATGLLSFLYFLLFLKMYRDPEYISSFRREKSAVPAAHETNSIPLGYLLRQRKVLGMVLGFGSYNYVFYLLLTWLPTYLSRALHIDLPHSFLYTGVPWLFATFTNLVIGGWLVDFLIRQGANASRVRRIVLIGGTAMGLGILGAAQAHSSVQALLWVSLSIGGLAAASPVGWSIPSLIVPGHSVGKVGGIINFSGQISGIAAPIVTGFMVNGHKSFAGAFIVAGVYLVIGIAGYILLLGKIQPVPLPEATT